jgi:GPH family glycoside/pentoside/hexuronide:cation symporter
MFYSLITLAKKVTASIAVPIVGVVLGITGYDSALPSQPPEAITGIRILTGPIPAVLLVGGIIFAIVYPLDKEKFSQIRKELQERRKRTGAS